MKNKILMFIAVFIVSIALFTDKVCAFSCKYYKDGNTSDKADLIINNISDYNKYDVLVSGSPLLYETKPNESVGLQNGNQVGPYIFFEKTNNDPYWYQGEFIDSGKLAYLSLYSGKNAYDMATSYTDDDGEKCPKLLRYKIYTSGWKQTYIRIHNDDLDVDPKEPANINEQAYDDSIMDELKKTATGVANFLSGFGGADEEGYLVSEKYKGTSVDELHDKYDCLTYTSYITAIEYASKTAGCENNQEFNRLYQDLKELCDYFRETQSYSEDGSSKAKKCSKACSNFKDDISDICKLSSTSGCNSLGPKVVKWIYKVIKWLRYIIPAIIIILVILEYIKALASDDEKAMKDATNHMFLRLVIATLIFILPFILDFVLNIFNITELDVNNLFCQK